MKNRSFAKIIVCAVLCAMTCSLTSCLPFFLKLTENVKIFEFVEVEGGYEVRGAFDYDTTNEDSKPENAINRTLEFIKTYSKNLVLDIPSEYNGKPVVSIAEEAFKFYAVYRVNIPDTVKVIGDGAFMGCILMIQCDIPSSVTQIGEKAFMGCQCLRNIVIPEGVTTIGDYAFWGTMRDKSVPPKQFEKEIDIDLDNYCSEVVISKTVTNIGAGAFSLMDFLTNIKVDEENQNYKSIDGNLYSNDEKTLIQYAPGKIEESFTVPECVTEIGTCAFSGCLNLKNITIPNHVKKIGGAAFRFMSSDLILDFGEEDPSFKIVDDILYNSDGSVLVMSFNSTPNLNFTVPDSVVNIEHMAFYDHDNLVSITFGENSQLGRVGKEAFYDCDSIESIAFPQKVKSISDSAIADCDKLETCYINSPDAVLGSKLWDWSLLLHEFYYAGTVDQMKEYLDREFFNFESSVRFVINCSDGIILMTLDEYKVFYISVT